MKITIFNLLKTNASSILLKKGVSSVMEEIFRQITYYLVSIVEMAASVIIGLASIRAVVKSLWYYFAKPPKDNTESIRLQLARWLSLGLEFELAADIMRTGLNPTWNEIGQLAAIAILRTALNYFIQKEIEGAIEMNKESI